MLEKIKSQLLPFNAKLIAVSKKKPNSSIEELYQAGQRAFGENRVQELVEKHETLAKDIEWHMIGHLQKNKVKYIAPFVTWIHAVDSIELLDIIEKQAKKNERTINVLLQFKIAQEDSKFGIDTQALISKLNPNDYKNVRLAGVMGMATFTDNQEQIREEFKALKNIFNNLKAGHFSNSEYFKEISMGMSGDYLIALEEGATMVRIGSLLFGKRN